MWEVRILRGLIWGIALAVCVVLLLSQVSLGATLDDVNRWEREKAVELLIKALKDSDSDVREAAALALGKIGDKRTVEPLIKALKDSNRWVCAFAALALGKIGDKRAVGPLIKALKDSNKAVRNAAVWALGEIGDKRVH